MEQDKFKKGIEEIKSIKLSIDEKSKLFNRLNHYSSNTAIVSPKMYWYNNVFQKNYMQMAFALIFIFGGSALAINNSEKSLPGDLLYSVKVNVNEPLRGVSLLNTSSKVKWEAKKLDRRFEEIEILAVQGKLDKDKSEKVQNKIDEHTEEFGTLVIMEEEELGKEEAQDSKEALKAKIEAHDRILSRLEAYSNTNLKEELSKFRSKKSYNKKEVKEVVEDNVVLMMSATVTEPKKTKFSTTTFFLKKKNVESKIKEAEVAEAREKLTEEDQDLLKKEILGDFQSDLKEAIETFKVAQEKENAGNLEEAVKDLNSSLKKLRSADVTLRQGIRFGVENSLRDK